MSLNWMLHQDKTSYLVVKANIRDSVNQTSTVRKNGAAISRISSVASFSAVDQQALIDEYLYVSVPSGTSDYSAYFSSNKYKLDYDKNKPVTLGQIGDKRDILNTNSKKLTKWIEKDFVLNGSLAWSFVSTHTGHKRVRVTLPTAGVPLTEIVVKYDGSYLEYVDISWDKADKRQLKSGGVLELTISDTDATGYDLTTTAGIQTYFDAKPYKISYVLATPVIENLTVEGDIVANGLTMVTLGSAVIVRERAKPTLNTPGNAYDINNTDKPTTLLNHRTDKIIDVFENGKPSTKWKVATTPNANGKQLIYIPKADFNPDVEYTVTYVALDRHLMTTNPIDIKATYAKQLRAAHDDLVVKVSDIATDVSILDRQVYKLLIAAKSNGWEF